METIPLEQKKKKKLARKVKSIKKNLKTGDIQLNEKPLSKKSNRQKKSKKKRNTGIMYIGHIPHGFYEDEMSQYFGQFGKVLSAVVARSKKTGQSKGFGFVEFKDEDVAQIAADAMNNYLMYNRILKCRVVPPEERSSRLVSSNSVISPIKEHKVNVKKSRNKSISVLDEKSYLKKTQQKIKQFEKFFKEKGIDFTYKIDNASEESNVDEMNSKSSPDKKTDNQTYYLEVDESDDEIQFKTPPQIKKIIKKSTTPSSTKKSPNNKRNNSPKQKVSNFKIEKGSQSKLSTKSEGIGKKLQKKKSKETTLTKSFKAKKNTKTKSLEKGVEAFLKQKGKENVKMVTSISKKRK